MTETSRSTSDAPATEAWLVPPLAMWPLGPRECLVGNASNGVKAKLRADEYAFLTACSGAKPLRVHEAEIVARFNVPFARRGEVRGALERCAALGLMLPVARSLGASSGERSGGACPVVIRTADRPALLARLLDDAARLQERAAFEREWHVLDDSRDPAHRAANQDTVARASVGCTRHDMHGRDPWREALEESFADVRSEIAWLLGGAEGDDASYGRPVNSMLLRFAGRRILALDDDALLLARRCPRPATGFAVGSGNDELFAYASEAALLDACEEAPEVNPIAEHERWLGLPVADAWQAATRAEGSVTYGLEQIDALRFADAARIVFTQNAAVGDPGSSLFPFHVLSLPAASLAHVTADAATEAAAFLERHAWRGMQQFRLAPRRLLTFTTLCGIDDRHLLPPTAPTLRNEDLLLGGMTALIHPKAWFADLDFGLPHQRATAKHWLGPEVTFRQEPLHVLMDLLEQRGAGVFAGDPGDRTHALASIAADISRMGRRELIECIEGHAIDTATRVLFSIRTQLDDPRVSASWKQRLEPWLASPALATEGPALKARQIDALELRDLARRYGEALALWPRLWNHCRETAT